MDSQFLKNNSSSDDDATHPQNDGEIPQMALDGLWEGFSEISNNGHYCYQLFTVTLPPWTGSTEQAPALEPTAQPATGNADSSDESAPNQTDIQPPHSDYATGPVAEAVFTSQTDAPINEEPRAGPTLMPSMVQNGSSPSSDSHPRELSRLQRRSRERQARALRRSVAHARAHAIAPSPSTSSATSPRSEKGEYMKVKKVSKSRKRDEKVKCYLCKTELSGDHEFDRHFKLVHQAEGWRWQVIDPFQKGLTPAPDHPSLLGISECKNCQSGKLYGINYNAAAHIRRVHFKNTPSVDGGSKGGSSGGAWPDIRYLEFYYMKMVQVQVRGSSRAQRRTPKEGVDYVRTGLEKETPYREPSGKRQSSEGASDFSAAELQAGFCNSFMASTAGLDLSPLDDEKPCVTPYTAEMATAWPALAFHPQGGVFHPNDSSCGGYDLL